jgi:hypothetical protein
MNKFTIKANGGLLGVELLSSTETLSGLTHLIFSRQKTWDLTRGPYATARRPSAFMRSSTKSTSKTPNIKIYPKPTRSSGRHTNCWQWSGIICCLPRESYNDLCSFMEEHSGGAYWYEDVDKICDSKVMSLSELTYEDTGNTP